MLKFQIAAATAALTANALKVGVISDMHTNENYNSWASHSNKCAAGGDYESLEAPIGRFKCDPSPTLIDYLFQRFTEVFGDVDVLLVTGDSVRHGTAPDHSDAVVSRDWPIIQANFELTTSLLK